MSSLLTALILGQVAAEAGKTEDVKVNIAGKLDLAAIAKNLQSGGKQAPQVLAVKGYPQAQKDPDVGKDMTALAIAKGYTSIEQHYVTTEDGYILGVFRIPRPRFSSSSNSSDNRPKPVVFLQHGLLDSSYAWICNSPQQSLGFILADAGYDVWFGNSRGNFYSTRHTKLKTNSREFWDFSWDEMAKYDLPAVVEYVLKVSGQPTLSYVGHSQGTIEALSGFSLNKTLAGKINFMGLLAPVAYVHHQHSIVVSLLVTLETDKLFELLGFKEFLPDATILQRIAPGICDVLPTGCDVFLYLIVGPSNNLNASRIEVYVSQTPAGTSVKNMEHWAQGVRAQSFQMYDYGCGLFTCENMKKYGQKTPPQYRLKDITIPTAIWFGGNDVLADSVDVLDLIAELPKSSIVNVSYQPKYAHLDYTWGMTTAVDVYAELLAWLESYAPK